MLRQLLDKGATANFSFARSIIVLEANIGTSHMYKLLAAANSRDALSAEDAQRTLKDILYNKWLLDGCEAPVDTQKTLSLIDMFVPFLPLERRHVRTVLEQHLWQRRDRGVRAGEFAELTWEAAALEFLTDRVEFEDVHAIEGAKEAPVVLSRHVSRALRQRAHRNDTAAAATLQLRLSSGGALVAEATGPSAAACTAGLDG
jgi:ATP-dependent Clp protease ATP-binding subunit ClpA